MSDFINSRYAKIFFESQIPSIVDSLKTIAKAVDSIKPEDVTVDKKSLEKVCELAKEWIDECRDMEDPDTIGDWITKLNNVTKILKRDCENAERNKNM